MKLPATQTLDNIQFLRAFAALLVVLHHLYPQYQAMYGDIPWIITFSKWGFVGVDIFFIISGYIMGYTTFHKPRGRYTAKKFLQHRLFRIYLGYWPFVIVMFFILLHFDPDKLHTLDISGSFFLLNDDMFQLILPISWSLTYELYFYFLFTITFFISANTLYKYFPWFLLFFILLIAIADRTSYINNSFFYAPFLLEFFLGLSLYLYQKYFMKHAVVFLILILFIVSLYLGIHYDCKNAIPRIFTFGISAFSLVSIFLYLESKNIFKSPKIFVLLGNASYTIYLSHLIVIALFYYLGLRDQFTSEKTSISLLGFILLFTIILLFSVVYYKKIEYPLYKKAIS